MSLQLRHRWPFPALTLCSPPAPRRPADSAISSGQATPVISGSRSRDPAGSVHSGVGEEAEADAITRLASKVAAKDAMQLAAEMDVELARVPGLALTAGRMFNAELGDYYRDKAFDRPYFGVTLLGSSHGFDPAGTTTGFVVWLNRRGTMVDPPPEASDIMLRMGIPPQLVDSIILTHCHGDHDAGTFRKILRDQNIKVYTTNTIMSSFLRKYAAISGFSEAFLRSLFTFVPVRVGEPFFVRGAHFHFFYSLHTIPCMGFRVFLDAKSIVYSADTHTDPLLVERMFAEGVVGAQRRATLLDFPWDADLILHEAGVPPIHTPISVLQALPPDVRSRLFLVHVAEKNVPPGCDLRLGRRGDTLSMACNVPPNQLAVEILDTVAGIELLRRAVDSIEIASHLLEVMDICCWQRGELIVKSGTVGDLFYVILEGTCLVSWTADNQVRACGGPGEPAVE